MQTQKQGTKRNTGLLILCLFVLMLPVLLCTGCGKGEAGDGTVVAENIAAENSVTWQSLAEGAGEQWKPEYATQFVMTKYDTYTLIEIADGQQILVVPENAPVPENLPEEMTVLQQPLEQLYVAASSAMDCFVELGALPQVALTSTTYENWSIPEVREALQENTLEYVGKYSAPDYEYVLDTGCDGVVESTMIYHSPETMEQLRKLGLPVMVERSSYEAHPMGRMEWIRLYGVLTGHEAEAETFFAEAEQRFRQVLKEGNTGKTVAFFYITSNGLVNVRKPGDYLATMIGLSGGNYVFENLKVDSDSATSGMNMEMESFYAGARDADVLIYNSTIDGGMETLEELLVKKPLLKDFRAVQQGNVWCTEKSMFQKTTAMADMMEDLHAIVTGEAEEQEQLQYLHRLR